MTDAFLAAGLLDPASYFGGEMKIDAERARAAIEERVASPLGLGVEAAVQAMESAWVGKIAASLAEYTEITPDLTLVAFGGAGPFAVCKVAEAAGITRVIIPGLAAVFSAFGIGFSDIGHEFTAGLPANDEAALAACRARLREQATRGMFAEGATLEECRVEETLSISAPAESHPKTVASIALPADLPREARLSLKLNAIKPLSHATLTGRFGGATHAARSCGTRLVLLSSRAQALPLYRVEEQRAGASAEGPAVLEEAFFTCRIDAGWRFELSNGGDILLTRVRGERS
jgi:N-methylhydantoinase A/oxoprolinase/acetone carboxylase beta subunit